ncbi:MAG: intradiol ring-cleavage dioxygenase [Gemmatimonadota bacterium]
MPHDDFGGLREDLRLTGAALGRRDLLRLAFGVGMVHLVGCDSSPTSAGDAGALCATQIPSETEGPFPADGSNGPDVLTQSGVVRSDIRSSFAGLSGTAAGIPLTVRLTLVSAGACTPLAGRAIYLWHCDREGRYSLYSSGATSQNYLRGVQESDADGVLSFTTVFPGCYAGRWPHIHFEVYESLAVAVASGSDLVTSQLALPESACDAVYATSGYEQSVTNLSRISLATDGIFRDGVDQQLATVTGDVNSGYVATLTVAV